ncbi:MAG: hypothetical protein ACRCTX_15935, partial [Afipia sp.]
EPASINEATVAARIREERVIMGEVSRCRWAGALAREDEPPVNAAARNAPHRSLFFDRRGRRRVECKSA